jgi:D-xylose 1-dehydrogenase (NADP+, D-xylono-1,5-lactone-forming)
MTVSWGLVSTAPINTSILAAARASDRADVVAVASRDQARAEAYARKHGIERAHGSYDALVEVPGVAAVYISLPNGLHVEWTMKALRAGKHFLCEKPFSRRAADVERAAARSRRSCSPKRQWRRSAR